MGCYEYGMETDSPEERKRYLKEAADEGYIPAMYEYGMVAVLGWYGLMLYLLYVGVYRWKYLNKYLVFSVVYWILRSLFSTLSPYRFIIFVLFLAVIEGNLQYQEIKKYESNNISRC